MYDPIENRDYVDKDHKIELEGMNATIYFMKDSNSSAMKYAQQLLMDAYSQRMKAI